jgi:integrase
MSVIKIKGEVYILPPKENQYYKEPAVLKTPASGDWYIYYNIWNFVKGKWEFVRYYTTLLNNKDTLKLKTKARTDIGDALTEECNKQLQLGMNPKTAKPIAPFDSRTFAAALEDARDDSPIPRLQEAMDKFISVKSGNEGKTEAAENKEYTAVTYTVALGQFKKYCQKLNLENQRMDKFTKLQVSDFLDEYYLADIWGDYSFNNNLGYIQSFFNYFAKKYDYFNPIKNIEKKEITEESDRFEPFTKQQVVDILDFLDKPHVIKYPHYDRVIPAIPMLALVARSIFYSFLRTSEIRRIKIKHVKRYRENYFDLAVDITKNKKKVFNEFYVDDCLIEHFARLGWEKYFEDKQYENYYVFTPDLIPSPKKTGNHKFGKNFAEVLDKMEKRGLINLDQPYSLYSLKHTGNIEAHKAGFDMLQLQLQNRHSSQQQTETYLRCLKLEVNLTPRPKRESL